MTFHIGQPVVCIKPGGWRELIVGETGPEFNEVYRIRSMDRSAPFLTLRFEEIVNPEVRYSLGVVECSFAARWFRPVVERKTDIGFAHDILKEVTEKVRVPA